MARASLGSPQENANLDKLDEDATYLERCTPPGDVGGRRRSV
jgi:hypothetical protein